MGSTRYPASDAIPYGVNICTPAGDWLSRTQKLPKKLSGGRPAPAGRSEELALKLTIVIPAYNEEEAIGPIIERTLAARDHIIANSPVDDVEIVVVSDGSTDGTVAIAEGYSQIKLVIFERNRGYGAALKRGFAEGSGELVGFLDADGTCDPRFFADLCAGLMANDASIALGSRMGPQSRMPKVRRLGNRIYAAILSTLANRVVQDTASGMRVIRRSALDRLYPLPDGLNFTPAMSARALLDDALPIMEIPMAYEERVGESKLHVLRDGWRFLQTILDMTLYRRPARLIGSAAALCAIVAVAFAMHPIEMRLTSGHLAESMIYRLMFCSFCGSLAVLLMCGLAVSEALHGLHREPRTDTLLARGLRALFAPRGLIAITAVFAPIIGWLIGPGVWSWMIERQVHVHWSRVVFAGLLAFTWCQVAVAKVLLSAVRLHVGRQRYLSRRSAAQILRATPRPIGIKPEPAEPAEIVLT
jgi:glycosyltransferase involved in cell wall biosynthesis